MRDNDIYSGPFSARDNDMHTGQNRVGDNDMHTRQSMIGDNDTYTRQNWVGDNDTDTRQSWVGINDSNDAGQAHPEGCACSMCEAADRDDDFHAHDFYHPDYDGPMFEEFETSGTRWTDGGGTTTTLGGSGGTINWSIGGAGLDDASGANFFSGDTVAISSFISYDFAAVIQDAFDQWSTYGDIDFVQVADGGGDIGVGSAPTIRIVGAFLDGASNTLGRAFTPSANVAGGDIVLDSGDASFFSDQDSFRLTIMHEIGHAIGLNHDSSSAIALMDPMFNSNLSGLQPDDIAGIQAIYGSAGSGSPDLVAGNVTVSNTAPAVGDTVTITYDITNNGNAVAADTTAGIYISTDNVITASDTFVTSELSDSSNAIGAIDSESVTFVLPTLASGTYYVGVIADINQNEPGESSETNNASPAPVQITVSGQADDFTETTATSGQIAVNGSTTGNIQFSGDEDWFKVNLTSGLTYKIDLEGSATSSGTLSDPFFRGIYDFGGTLIGMTTDDDSGVGINSMLTYTATYSGIHYLSAGAFGAGQGTYTLSIEDDIGAMPQGVNVFDDTDFLLSEENTLADALSFGGDGYRFEVVSGLYTANPESVTVSFDDTTFELPSGVTPTLTLDESPFVTSLTVLGTGDATVIGNSGNNVLRSAAGNDTLSGGAGDDQFHGGTGGDALNGGADTDSVYYSNAGSAVRANLDTGAGTLGDANGDTLISIENLYGSAYADTLIGGAGANLIAGLGGNDILLDLSGGADQLFGGNGNDQLQGGAGGDIINGGADIDAARYNTSDAAVMIDLGADTATGGHANGDSLDLIENLFGSQFGDTLTGDNGVNVLDGFSGDDTLRGGDGADVLIGAAGFDTADYSDSGTAVDIGLFRTGTGGTAQGDTLNGVEAITGSGQGDTLVGSGFYAMVRLDGGNGDDLLFDYGGASILNGGNGNDTMIGRLGADQFDGGADTDTVRYADAVGAVNANLQTGMGSGTDAQGDTFVNVENLVGSRFFDTLVGDSGDNRLEGLAGRDTITGGDGDDQMFGGADLDTFVFTTGNWGNDIIHDFDANPGREKMDMSSIGIQFSDLSIVDTAFGVRVDFDHPSFGIQTIALGGVGLADITADDFIFAI